MQEGGGYNFGPEKMFSGVKSVSFSNFRGKYRIVMLHSLLERIFCDVIYLKLERPIT